MTGFGIAMELLWYATSSFLVHGLLFGTIVIVLIWLGRWILRTMPRRFVVWLWLPLLLLVFSPVLPGIGITMPDIPHLFSSGAVVPDTTVEVLVGENPSSISTELLPGDVSVQIQTNNAPVTCAVRYIPTWQHAVGLLWLVGVVTVFGYRVYRYSQVRQMFRDALEIERQGRIRICTLAGFRTPFVYGLFCPRIVLPQTPTISAREREMILLHEHTHVRRLDVLWRYLWEVALCVYWFQPLLWLAEDAFIVDTEGACDEAVLSLLDADRACRADYAQTLLLYAGPKKREYPTAFGMSEMKGRVHAILYPGSIHAAGIIGLVVVILLVSAVALLSPVDSDDIADKLSTEDSVAAEIQEGVHTAVIRVEPTSALFGFVDGYIESHPEIWRTTDFYFELPVGWSVEPQTGVFGYLFDAAGVRCGTYTFTAFSPIDGADIPPENIPPTDQKWMGIYANLRLSAMQNVADADYQPIVTEERFESAIAVMDQAIYEEGIPAAAWEHQRVPLVLAYDQDCSMYVQMTFDVPTDEQIMETIAASVAFEIVE